MAELERMKPDERMYKSYATLQASTETALERAYKLVKDMAGRVDTGPDDCA